MENQVLESTTSKKDAISKLWLSFLIVANFVLVALFVFELLFAINYKMIFSRFFSGGFKFGFIELLLTGALLLLAIGLRIASILEGIIFGVMPIAQKAKGDEFVQKISHAMKLSAVNLCAIPFGVALSTPFYHHSWLTALRVIGFIVVGVFFFGNSVYESLYKKKENFVLRLVQDVIKGAILVAMTVLLLRLNPIETVLSGISVLRVVVQGVSMDNILGIGIMMEFILPVVVLAMSIVFFQALLGYKDEEGSRVGRRAVIVAIVLLVHFLMVVVFSLGALSFSGAVNLWFAEAKTWILPMVLLAFATFCVSKGSLS